jgi:hypothetical protein
MRFVCFLLSLVTALTAVVTFMVALFSNFTDDPHNPVTPWARALFGDAAVLGVAGMVMSAITFVVSTNPTPPPLSFKVLSVLLSGAIPAVAAATGAIMTRRLLEPEERVTLA